MPACRATPSTDGLARLEWSVPEAADIVIVELGANDALRGIDPEVTRDALDQIILAKLRARGQAVLLAGMLAPRNLGDEYGEAFDAIYPDLAAQYDVAFYPVLSGRRGDRRIAQSGRWNAPDGGGRRPHRGRRSCRRWRSLWPTQRRAAELTNREAWQRRGRRPGRSPGPPAR